MIKQAVRDKKQNYDLWQSGAYGNKLKAWRTINEWRDSGYRGKVALRYLGRSGGGACTYNLHPKEVDAEVSKWVERGLQVERMMLNEMADGNSTVLQGEYFSGVMHAAAKPESFFFSLASVPMRLALKSAPQHTNGLRARLLLRHFMTPSSHADFVALLDQYPEHVVEVSVFERCLGDLPQRNALVWEVRQY